MVHWFYPSCLVIVCKIIAKCNLHEVSCYRWNVTFYKGSDKPHSEAPIPFLHYFCPSDIALANHMTFSWQGLLFINSQEGCIFRNSCKSQYDFFLFTCILSVHNVCWWCVLKFLDHLVPGAYDQFHTTLTLNYSFRVRKVLTSLLHDLSEHSSGLEHITFYMFACNQYELFSHPSSQFQILWQYQLWED